MDNIDFEVKKLSDSFYQNYPTPPYVELLRKENRPYSCLMIKVNTYYICIPYRSKMSHKQCFPFKTSNRANKNMYSSCLDYSKVAIISNTDYIDPSYKSIDKDEYLFTVENIDKIAKEVTRYIRNYINHHKGVKIMNPKEYARKYSLSTLPYFHIELGL